MKRKQIFSKVQITSFRY